VFLQITAVIAALADALTTHDAPVAAKQPKNGGVAVLADPPGAYPVLQVIAVKTEEELAAQVSI